MAFLRRLLGLFVMLAGIIGLLLSLAGLTGLWLTKPTVAASVDATLSTLLTTVDVSRRTLEITNRALGATVTSLEALSDMLGATAATVEDTQPVITQVNGLMGETLPAALTATSDSLETAAEAAQSLESAIQSFDTFRAVLGATPLLSAFVPASQSSYDPEKPLAASLAELSETIDEMPATFEDISVNLERAGGNLDAVKLNLDTMSQSVSLISAGLEQYQAMVSESEVSMDNIKAMLAGVQDNLPTTLNAVTIVIGLLLTWLLAAQAVIFSQGWELYHGTAGRMDGPAQEPATVETAAVSTEDAA